MKNTPSRGGLYSPFGRGGLDTSDGWFIAPPMSSEETPPTPSPPNGEDCALLRSFLLSPRGRPRGGPGFPSRRKRDCARRRVPEANRREAAALRPEANGPCTVQKNKRSIAPAGDGRRGDAQEVLPPGTQVSSLRHSLCGGFGGYRMDKLLFPLPLTWRQRVDVRLFPGLPFYRQATL